VKEIASWIVIIGSIALSFVLSCRAMNAMMVHDNAHIFLSTQACPVPPKKEGFCEVTGSLTRSFLTEEVEITLADGSLLLVPSDSLQGYATSGADPVRYLPFGKFLSGVIGMLILLAGPACGFLIPAYLQRSGKRSKAA
jgi:hypothetical protein